MKSPPDEFNGGRQDTVDDAAPPGKITSSTGSKLQLTADAPKPASSKRTTSLSRLKLETSTTAEATPPGCRRNAEGLTEPAKEKPPTFSSAGVLQKNHDNTGKPHAQPAVPPAGAAPATNAGNRRNNNQNRKDNQRHPEHSKTCRLVPMPILRESIEPPA